MFEYSQLKDIHLEVTSRCQASCPMCLRNHHGGQKNHLLELHDWTLENFKSRLNRELLEQLHGFYFCGNLGDPIINNDLQNMIEYAVSVNPALYIRLHTNGSAKTHTWWEELAEVLPTNHLVTFALDGLEDTHILYRTGTNYNKIIKNAKAFIDAGGRAEWCFIKFKHNEHQVDSAEQLASDLGFKKFTVKNTGRFIAKASFDVLDTFGNITHELQPPTDMYAPIVSEDHIAQYKKITESSEITCVVQQEKSIYIDCRGDVYPCCWLGSIPWMQTEKSIADIVRQDMKQQWLDVIQNLGGLEKINTDLYTIQEIIDNNKWQTVWDHIWHVNKNIMCAKTCGKMPVNVAQPTKQQRQVTDFD